MPTSMEKWKTLHSEYLHKSDFVHIRKDRCELPDGLIIDDYCVNEYPDWVNAIVITKEQQMVLVEQYRHAGEDFFLEIPAGKKENGETDEEGILREVKEETGYVSSVEPTYLGEFMINPATQTNKVKTYLIEQAYKAHDQDLDDTEDITARLFDFDSFGTLITENKVKTQLFTAHAYFMAKARLLNK
ncbi:NUDIX hydrolase [Salimicrobium halophilum]|uniref:NUDIX domain-containing protein n=1 Tax=Salimicrobium halophilum TaxID=86666 RepID=A0A1G8RHP2_9BACI|nr:NUDIX hydrolase [Salimicrobium halophilum]SDJ15880.1 NUDIX domain-containing protein [Salimicrobium halophilum]